MSATPSKFFDVSIEPPEVTPQVLILTRLEAAQRLRISVSQLDAEARKGHIRRIKLGEAGRARVLYREADLLEYLDAHCT